MDQWFSLSDLPSGDKSMVSRVLAEEINAGTLKNLTRDSFLPPCLMINATCRFVASKQRLNLRHYVFLNVADASAP